jgi:hypothetical protein
MGLFKKRIEKVGREHTEAAVERANSSEDPIERTLGPGGQDKVREAMAGLERFGIHLDADDALGTSPAEGAAERKGKVEGTMHVVAATQLDASQLRAPCHMTYVLQAPGVEAISGEGEFEIWSRQWPNPGEDLPVRFDPAKPQKVKILWDQVMSHADSAKQHADELAAQLRGEGDAGPAGAAGQPGAPGAPTITPIVIGNADPERVKEAMARAEQALGIDLDGDGVVGGGVGATGSAGGTAAPGGGAAASTGDPAPASGSGEDQISKIERIAKLRDSGTISDQEFERMKRAALGEDQTG